VKNWTYPSLWQKAKLYGRRATAEDRESALFALWATLCLEFLARATLAKVHPALLADPREPDNLMYAFGFRTDKSPKSIPAKALFARCKTVAVGFTDAEQNFCMSLIERRNDELHSGTLAFDDLKPGEWLARYFRVCDLLLEAQGKKLGHLFGGTEADIARRMIAALETKTLSKVKAEIAARRKSFEALADDERAKRRKEGTQFAFLRSRAYPLARLTRCPACQTTALSAGKRVRASEPTADEDQILVRIAALPVRFGCAACYLQLLNHAEMHAAGLGGQYTVTETLDPADYYGLVYADEPDFYGEEYMNE
jgi:hypothetical protein